MLRNNVHVICGLKTHAAQGSHHEPPPESRAYECAHALAALPRV
jgi:hypothetical protein